MFDAKSLLENLVRNAAPSQGAPQGGGGGLADILGQVLQGGQAPAGGAAQGGGGLADILGKLQGQLGGAAGNASPTSGGGLGDILGQLRNQIGGAPAGQQGGGGLMDVLGQVLSQATQGVKEGAGKVDNMAGVSDALAKATGQSPAEIRAKLEQLVRDNPLAAGGALGGLGGLLLGTRSGRSVLGGAAKIGALALIGGLAYKAVQNYQSGKPLIAGAAPAEAAPQGSGFEPAAISNDAAILYIRAMIAAAAADGRIDSNEQTKILGSLKQAGLDQEAEEFLAHAFNNPLSAEDLAASVGSAEVAVQVYTAARIAIEPDTNAETTFLARLAAALGMDPKLAQHIDAQARAAA